MWQILAIVWSTERDVGAQLGDYELVTYQDLSAIITHSDYESINNLSNFERVDALFQYQTVLERASIDRMILPVRFGTMAKNKKDVEMILQEGANKFRSLLKYAENKAEFDLMGIWKEEIGRIEQDVFENLENSGYAFKIHQPVNNAICFHLSILMSPEEQEMFADIKDDLDRRFGQQIDVRMSEPLPPYTFFTLDLKESMGQSLGGVIVDTIRE
jgi:hypothetical protein